MNKIRLNKFLLNNMYQECKKKVSKKRNKNMCKNKRKKKNKKM